MSQPANPPAYDAIYSNGMQGYPIQTQPQGQVVIQVPQQPIYRPGGVISMGMNSSTVICHSCNHMVLTRIQIVPALKTHVCVFCMCVFGLWPCCFIPYCIPSCNHVDHFCPNCDTYIGTYKG